MKSQKQQVLEYLQKGYSLTPKEALKMFGSFRLSAVIFDLVKEGHNIENVQSETVYPLGSGVFEIMSKQKTRYAEYVYIRPIRLPSVIGLTVPTTVR